MNIKTIHSKLYKFANDFLFKFNPRIPTRPTTSFMETYFKEKELVGVEIGTCYGDNAQNILNRLSIKKLYCIDPFKPWIRDNIYFNYDNYFEIAKKNLSKYRDKIVFVKKYSDEAVNDIPNAIDFVYIDGNHQYEFVVKDIQNYILKVKKGGVIGGHDVDYVGVCRAVMEYVIKNNIDIKISKSDWWFVK